MANPYLILWCDATNNRLYSGWQISTEATTPILKQGDNIGVEIHRVYRAQFGAPMDEIPFPPSATVRLAVGEIDSAPVDGTFNLTYGTSTTPDLAFDTTAAELETALNALADIIADGGVTVTKTGNNFRIVWNVRAIFTDTFSAEIDALSPTSEAAFIEVNAGSATANRIFLFKLRQSAIAAQVSFTATPPPAITITASDLANTYRLDISPAAKTGVFTISMTGGIIPPAIVPFNVTSAPISVFDTPITIQNILGSLGVGDFSVSQVSTYSWEITTPSVVDTFTATSGLVGFSSVYGILNMNTAEVEEFLSGVEEGTTTLEVEVDIAGEIQTIIQTPVRIINDLIQTSSFTLVDMGEVMPVDSVVRYDTAQALTAPEQEQARLNIDSVSLAEVTASLSLGNLPTNNEKGAMQYSILPSTSNPFVTMSERNSFDQDLNTTDDVQFNTVTVGTASVVIDGTSVSISDATDTLLLEPAGITFEDGTVQTTAWDVSTQFIIAGSNPSGAKYINLDIDGGVGAGGDPFITIQKSGEATVMTMTGVGLTFPDGTSQTTAAVADGALYLTKAGNFSGLVNVSTARTNLGLGTMAVANSIDYLAKSGNLSGLTSTSTARTNLGLGTMAVAGTVDYLAKADNLSGLTSLSTARTNLGLGTANTVTFNQVVLGTSITFPDSTVQTTAATGGYTYDITAYENWTTGGSGGSNAGTRSGGGYSAVSYSNGGIGYCYFNIGGIMETYDLLGWTIYKKIRMTFDGTDSNGDSCVVGFFGASGGVTAAGNPKLGFKISRSAGVKSVSFYYPTTGGFAGQYDFTAPQVANMSSYGYDVYIICNGTSIKLYFKNLDELIFENGNNADWNGYSLLPIFGIASSSGTIGSTGVDVSQVLVTDIAP